jgi:glycosyltransferase involved in cell wall biosynthesis
LRDVYVVVPDGIDDPARPSGGNTYDRHLCRELGSHGWPVQERPVAGFWGRPDAASFAALEATLRQIPDGAVVLLDGLIASNAPEVLVPQASRLRLIVLVHMPLGHRPADDEARRREGAVLDAATAIVTTSFWARRRLIELYGLPAERVRVAEPGAPVAEPATGTGAGGALLCVGAVSFEKGHDILLEALESIAALSWHCTCAGSLDRDPAFVESLRRRALDRGLGERVSFLGPRTGADLDRRYKSADLLVHASRAETYGLVVTEALARGLPVVAAEVGGLAEALGEGADGTRPGSLVAAEDQVALAGALSAWLGDAELRARLRRAAAERRESLPRWSTTASEVARVLAEAAAWSAERADATTRLFAPGAKCEGSP